jgi:type IV pilus assembly protein PilW
MNAVIPSAGRSVIRWRQSGFSLIELMVAITISLIILAALTVMFVTSSRAREEITRANQQIENGRYAMQVLADDLRLAGYYGGFDPRPLWDPAPPTFAPDPPDPCNTTLAALKANLSLHIQGYDEGTGITTACNTALVNRKAGTDVVVIRRVSTCKAGPVADPDCGSLAGHYYFQASHCSVHLNAASAGVPYAADGNAYILAINASNAALNRTQKDCTALADIRRLITHIYYIDEGSYTDADGRDIPTLVRAELKGGNFSTRTPLAEGIEELELQYRDIDNAYITPASADEWHSVVAAELSLLARSTDPTPNHTDTKTYTLGPDTFTPGGSYKRHVFQTNVLLSNPAGLYKP